MLEIHELNSIADLRHAALAWDDLWRRSSPTAPTARAELVALWLEHFAPQATLRAIVVEQDGVWVAALPLIGRRVRGVLEIADLPGCAWSSAGELLIAADCSEAALDLLVHHVSRLPWPLLWLAGVNSRSPAWQRYLLAAERSEQLVDRGQQDTIGWIDIEHNWPACLARLSKSFRRELARTHARLSERGRVQIETITQAPAEQAVPLLRRVFEVEDRGWKGPAGTSVLQTPGMLEFFQRQARQLAAWNMLDLFLLRVGDEPIASGYGYRASGISYLHKVGYDAGFSRFGPGQLLMHDMLREFHADPARQAINMLGPLTEAVGKWTTSSYAEGRLAIAPNRPLSRLLLGAHRACARGGIGPWKKVVRIAGMDDDLDPGRRGDQEMPVPRAVVFDLDGLMFNTEELYQLVGDELLGRRGKPFDRPLRDATMGRPARVAFRTMIDWHGMADTVDQLALESEQIFTGILATRLAPMPGLPELLTELERRGIPKAIATSSGRRYVEYVLGRFGYQPRFEFILTAEDVVNGKPHPEIYLQAAERFGVLPAELLVLEDSHAGCSAAIAAGAFAVAVPGDHSREHDFSGAAMVIEHLADRRLYKALG